MSDSVIATVKGEFIFRLFKEVEKATLAENTNGKTVVRDGSEVFFFYDEKGFGLLAHSLERNFIFVDEFQVLFNIDECNKGCISYRCIKTALDYFVKESTWKKDYHIEVNSYGTIQIGLPEKEKVLTVCKKAPHDQLSHIDEVVSKARRFFAASDDSKAEVPLEFLTGKHEDMDVRMIVRTQTHLTEGELKYMNLHPIKLAARASKLNKYFFIGGAVTLQEPKLSWK